MEREQHHKGRGRRGGGRDDGGRGGGGGGRGGGVGGRVGGGRGGDGRGRGGGGGGGRDGGGGERGFGGGDRGYGGGEREFGGGDRGYGGGDRGYGGGERGYGGDGRGYGGGGRGYGGGGRGFGRGGTGDGGGRGQGRGRGHGIETREPLVTGTTRSMQQLSLAPVTAPDAGRTVVPSVAESEEIYTPRRPVGTKGRPISLDTNFFKINLDFRVVNHYDIAISTEPKNKSLRREIIQTMCNAFPNVFGGVSLVYDGAKNVFTSGDIHLQEAQQAFSVKLNNRKNPYEVKVQLVAKINLLDLDRFLKQEQDSYEKSCISVLDVVLRQLPMERNFNTGKYFYTYFDNAYYGPGLQQWHGYFQSVRPGWKYAFIQMDTSTRIFHKEQTLIQYLCELLRTSEDNLKRVSRFERSEMRDINEKLDGLSIVTTHLPYPASYRLIGLGKCKPSDQKFSRKLDNGQTIEVSVERHFQETYNMRLSFPNLPCVRAHPPDGQRYFPIELCNVKSGQQYRKLTEKQKAQLIKASAKPAYERRETIKGMITERDYQNDSYVKGFGMSVDTNMTTVTGRVLDPPTLLYNNERKVTPEDGSWRADRCTYFDQITVKQMAVLVCCNIDYDVVQRFIKSLQRIGMEKGLKLPHPSVIKECDGDVEAELTEMKRRLPDLQLCLAILPSDSSSKKFYCELKRAGDTILGLTTQIVKDLNVEKCNTVTVSNICLKINAKLGGTNNVIAGPHQQLTIVMKEPVIIFGADVTHPSPQNRHYPSVAAVVASFDKHAARYDTVIGLQEYKKEDHEIIAKMNAHVKKLLLNFYHKTGKAKPTKIIFYRDGVSEGEFDQVLKREMTAIQQACTELSKDYKPKITLIVVQKRHHARFFPKRKEDESGRAKNIPPGTVVDTDITNPLEFDYYLNSHQGIQGTCKPAHYNVLWDDSNFTADELQEMSYQLCHMYARCTRSVSIPAPAYYAHLVAFRARAYLDSMPDTEKLLDSDVQSVEALLQDINNRCQPHANMPGMYFA